MSDYQISGEKFWTGSKYRLYHLDEFGEPRCFAECNTPADVGLALVTCAEDARLAGEYPELVGVLDAHQRRWVAPLWSSRRSTPFQ